MKSKLLVETFMVWLFILIEERSFFKLIVVSSLSELGILLSSSFLNLKFAMFESSFELFSDFALLDKTDKETLFCENSFSAFLFFGLDFFEGLLLIFMLLSFAVTSSFSLNLGLSLIFFVLFKFKN